MMKKVLTVIFICITCSAMAQSPSADITKGGIDDGKVLFGAYLNPLLKGWSSGVNNTWFNSANCNKWGQFSLSVNGGLFFVPPSEQTFDVNNLSLKNTRLAGGQSNSLSPTFFGSNTDGPKMEVIYKSSTGTDIPVSSYNLPSGFNYFVFPSIPAIQLFAGLPKHTELMVRFVPRINMNGFNANMLGLGIKHDVMPWIFVKKRLPFDFSVVAAFNNTNAQIPVAEEDRIYPERQSDPGAQPKAYYDNQRFLLTSKAFMSGVILSKTFKFFTIYTSGLYNVSNMQFGILGNYPVHSYDPIANPFGATIQNIEDPITLTLLDNRFKSNSGITFTSKYVTTNIELTYANFINLSAGLSLNLQLFNKGKKKN